jgi:hypothetical protein
MVLAFTALDKFGHQEKYSWSIEFLECALDTLSSLTPKGRRTLQADCIEDEHRVRIPVEIFSGACLSVPMKQLEDQWQFILSQPGRIQIRAYTEVRTSPFCRRSLNELVTRPK